MSSYPCDSVFTLARGRCCWLVWKRVTSFLHVVAQYTEACRFLLLIEFALLVTD